MKPIPTTKPDHKYYPSCKTEKPFVDFYSLNGKRRRLSGECKPCHRQRYKMRGDWKRRPRELVYPVYRKRYLARRSDPANVEIDRQRNRDHHRRKVYNIDADTFNRMSSEQKGKCAICKKSPQVSNKRTYVLNVDHSHSTGKVRGLLCFHCNSGLGKFRDNPELLQAALGYLFRAEF